MHFGEGDDFVEAEHGERVIKPGSSDLGGEPVSSCCAEQGPAKFQLPLPVDHGQAEPTAPDEGAVGASVSDPLPDPIGLPLPSHLRGRGCRLFRRPGIGPVGDVGVAVHQGKDRRRALHRQGPIPTEAFRSSSAHHTRSSVGLRSVVRLHALGDSMGLNRTRSSGCKGRARGRRAASRPASGMPGVPKSVRSTHGLGGPHFGHQDSR